MLDSIKQNMKYFDESVNKLYPDERLFCRLDMPFCTVTQGSSIRQYIWYEFKRFNGHERRKFMTDHRYLRKMKRISRGVDRDLMLNKKRFLNEYGEFVSRRWLDSADCTEEEIRDFVSSLGAVIVKPYAKLGGEGVFKYEYSEADFNDFIERSRESLIEEIIIQHPAMAGLNPNCVNTVRLVTYANEGEIAVIVAVLRIGAGTGCVDNLSAGGTISGVDIDTGLIVTPAINRRQDEYLFSPVTGEQIIGFEIPHWGEAKRKVLKAAALHPEIRYVGWDAAITPEGVEIIEANPHSGLGVLQMADKKGRRDLEGEVKRSKNKIKY